MKKEQDAIEETHFYLSGDLTDCIKGMLSN